MQDTASAQHTFITNVSILPAQLLKKFLGLIMFIFDLQRLNCKYKSPQSSQHIAQNHVF